MTDTNPHVHFLISQWGIYHHRPLSPLCTRAIPVPWVRISILLRVHYQCSCSISVLALINLISQLLRTGTEYAIISVRYSVYVTYGSISRAKQVLRALRIWTSYRHQPTNQSVSGRKVSCKTSYLQARQVFRRDRQFQLRK